MAKGKRERPVQPKYPDVEMDAGAKTRQLRFKKTPRTQTRFHGRPDYESASGSDRDNLPAEVEPDVTYRDSSIRWQAASMLVMDERLREVLGGEDVEVADSELEQRSSEQNSQKSPTEERR